LHFGHIFTLETALNYKKEMTYSLERPPFLLVGINSNLSVKKYKGENRPIIDEINRSKSIVCLSFVDAVYIYDEETSEKFVEIVKPDFHVNSSSYGEDCVERKILDSYGGHLVIVEEIENSPSTTNILNSVLNLGH